MLIRVRGPVFGSAHRTDSYSTCMGGRRTKGETMRMALSNYDLWRFNDYWKKDNLRWCHVTFGAIFFLFFCYKISANFLFRLLNSTVLDRKQHHLLDIKYLRKHSLHPNFQPQSQVKVAIFHRAFLAPRGQTRTMAEEGRLIKIMGCCLTWDLPLPSLLRTEAHGTRHCCSKNGVF